MDSSTGVFLVADDAQTTEAVTAALKTSRRLVAAGTYRSLSDLAMAMHQSPAQAAVVDLGNSPEQMLAELGPITNRFAGTRFVVLADDTRSDLMLQAMEAGARHFLSRKQVATQLINTIHRLIADSQSSSGQGMAVTILSAGGGCGATTIAANLAHELRLASSDPSLLVDMDLAYGAAATYLGMAGGYGLSDVLSYDGTIDSHLVAATAVTDPRGLNLLLSPAAIHAGGAEAWPSFERLGDFVEACKRAYRYTVFDAPRLPASVNAGLARVSQLTVIVCQLRVTDLRTARGMIESLTAGGCQCPKVVISRYRKGHSMISLSEALKCLSQDKVTTLSNDYAGATQSLNYGQLLADSRPKSALRREIRELALEMVQQFKTRGHA